MRALPRISNPDAWRQRAEAKERDKRSAKYERRNQVIAVAREIRREIRDEQKLRRAS
jgi:hypothetical protein